MERSAWPKNLSSSRKRMIKELLQDQNPTKKLRDLFDAHSQAGNHTRQPMSDEDLAILLDLCRGTSLSSFESDEVSQLRTKACFRSLVSEDSVKSPVRRRTLDKWAILGKTSIDDGCKWKKYGQKAVLNMDFPRNYFRCYFKIDEGCQATKQVQKIKDDPPLYRTIYQGDHTCKNHILKSPQLILGSPSPGNSCYFTAEQDNDYPFSPSSSYSSVNQEQTLPSEDDVNQGVDMIVGSERLLC